MYMYIHVHSVCYVLVELAVPCLLLHVHVNVKYVHNASYLMALLFLKWVLRDSCITGRQKICHGNVHVTTCTCTYMYHTLTCTCTDTVPWHMHVLLLHSSSNVISYRSVSRMLTAGILTSLHSEGSLEVYMACCTHIQCIHECTYNVCKCSIN